MQIIAENALENSSGDLLIGGKNSERTTKRNARGKKIQLVIIQCKRLFFLLLWAFGFIAFFIPWSEDTGLIVFLSLISMVAAIVMTIWGVWKDWTMEYKKMKSMTPEAVCQYIKAQEQQRQYVEQQRQREEQQRQREEQQRRAEVQKRNQELAAQGIVSCPKCASTSIATLRSRPMPFVEGYSATKEITGLCDFVNVCQSCGHRFYP